MGKDLTEAKVNEFGSRLNTIGAKLDEMLTTGLDAREARKNLNIRSRQVFQHLKKLKDRGYICSNEPNPFTGSRGEAEKS